MKWIPVIGLAGATMLTAAVKVEETVVGPVNAGGLYVVSQNDARIAYVGAKGTRTVVSVDGVEGPVLDELFNGSAAVISGAGPILVHNANAGGKFNGTPTAVIFSEAGSHYAYIGRQGNEYVVVHDGKEIGRGPRSALSLSHSPLGLSPRGKFAFWGEMRTEGGRGQYRLVVNGKPEPWAGHQDLKPVFSPDDSHYAYTAGTVADYQKPMLVIDGKVAGYIGGSPQFTSDNRLIVTAPDLKGVFVDGKKISFDGIGVEKVSVSPKGGRHAVIVRKRLVNYQGVGVLYLDGKEVPGTDGALDITFSPDGKRYALRCTNPEAKSFFMIIDGKKATEYQSVAEKAYWTPDSATVIYQISSSGRNFVVVNADEFAVQLVNALLRSPFAFAGRGGRYGFSSADGSNRNFLTIVDGKQVLPAGLYPDGSSLDFSEDGSRYAFVAGQVGRLGMTTLIDDGKANEKLALGEFGKFAGGELVNPHFVLSPNGKYLARMARTPQNKDAGLYINETLVYPTTLQVAYPAFTADSKHVAWLAAERAEGRPGNEYVVYVDGESALKLTGDRMIGTKGSWSMGADGVLTCLGTTADAVKRWRLTPSSGTDIDAMTARAKETREKAITDAAAAKQKADDDALVAKEKAAADAAAAAAKRKADYDAAVAAKAKARADALAARKKAAEDAAAARRKK